jgi:hypothetical protein
MDARLGTGLREVMAATLEGAGRVDHAPGTGIPKAPREMGVFAIEHERGGANGVGHPRRRVGPSSGHHHVMMPIPREAAGDDSTEMPGAAQHDDATAHASRFSQPR